jgi:two-component system, NarL family, response regulator YdfI
MPRVLIAAASEFAHSWFAAFPAQTETLSIVGILRLDRALPTRVHELAPDVIVLDAADTDAESLAQILESVSDPAVDIVVLSNGETVRANRPDLMRTGVRAILFNQPTVEELEAVIRAIAAGFVVLDLNSFEAIGRTDDSAVPAMTSNNEVATASLTPREIDVLNALAEGLGNKQIAARLGISEHTVKTHLAAVFEKLEASNRTEAVMAGARLGLILL